MKVLISAYACEPNKGSEPEVGFRIVLAAARTHEVWVLTRENNVEPLEMALEEAGVAHAVRVVGVDSCGIAFRLKPHGPPFLHWYYDRWQRAAARVAADLDRQIGFDLVHHATFAAYWTRTGVASLSVPLVWGPVGGGARTPRGLLRTLGARGLLGEALREGTRPVIAAMHHARATASIAAALIAQNPDTVVALGSPPNAIVLPNALSVNVDAVVRREDARSGVVFASRLVPWKAAALAVETMAYLRSPDAILHIYGDGPDRGRVERQVAARDLESRVLMHGQVSRQRLLEAVASAQVLLHPALHDEASLTVAEALSLGTPIVALDHAGPAAVAGHWPSAMSRLVDPTTPNETALNFARAVDSFLDEDADVRGPFPQFDFHQALLEVYRSAYEAGEASRKV